MRRRRTDEERFIAGTLPNGLTNRWSVKPELGISQAVGPVTLELAAGATVYTENHDFLGQSREQAPVYSLQGNVVYVVVWPRARPFTALLGLRFSAFLTASKLFDGGSGGSLWSLSIGEAYSGAFVYLNNDSVAEAWTTSPWETLYGTKVQ